MEKWRKISVTVILLVMSVEICLAQHWSYGLQPGFFYPVESFQEIANKMEKLGEVQKAECPGSHQHSRFSDLKEAM
ncbi:Progonadoliberin-1, partial [Podiceps cristatus]